MRKNILSTLLLLCTVVQGVWAEEYDGLPIFGDLTLQNGRTYRVSRNFDYDWGRLTVNGNVRLIVDEGITLDLPDGIELSDGSTLTIEGPGTININKCAESKAGIGAYRMGTLIINGGTLNVRGGMYAAGIGGNYNNIGGGRIVINDGVVNAWGNRRAAAIGGGDIVINGGQVTADCGDGGIGFGGGYFGSLTIYGGSLTIGWTNPDDFVKTSGNSSNCYRVNSISFASGKQFVIEGTQTIANAGNIADKKIVPYVTIAALPGNGTADNPYTISSADEWDRFAMGVAFGNNYSGKFVKLTADISVTQKCGYVSGATPSRAFSGIFDGGGKTITAAIFDEKHQGTALFCYINDATIKNLTVAGTVNASKSYTAGLVGFADGTNLIENCTVNATLGIKSDYAAGFVGNGQASATTIRNCVFAGIVNGTNGRRAHVGGIYGWTTDGTPTLQNCLEKGTYNNITSMHPMGLQNDRGTINLCYYVNTPFGNPANACTVSGAYRVATAALEGEISRQQQLVDGSAYYIPCIVSDWDEYYELKDRGVSITPNVKCPDGTRLTLGTDYTATLDGNAVAAYPLTVNTPGKHTLAITGKADCIGTKNITFTVVEQIVGDGSEANPYIISTPNQWSLFAALVNNGTDFSGQFVKLDNDIAVTEMVGANSEKAFKGTFLGNGKTLTVTLGTASQPAADNCAPFRFVNGATIKDLKVKGNIYTCKKFAAGLVSRSYGTTTITDCQVSTVIHSSIRGDGTHGGLVAMPGGQLTITGCIYNGRLLTSNGTNSCGGFVGWHNGQSISITSSLYAPNTNIAGTTNESPINHGATFVRGASAGSYCYYTNPMGEAQGRQVFDSQPAEDIYIHAQAADGKTYYLPCIVNGIETSYTMEGGSISITPTVTGVEAALTLGTDYTATLDGLAVTSFPVTITTKGTYTLTLTGNTADCAGARSFTFAVKVPLAGTGTEENPYLISNTDDWDNLADDVAQGKNYSGKFVKLNADISVTTMMGTGTANSFQGTFDGGGHTLTFTGGSPESPFAEERIAPFCHVNSATIKNLKVAGDIYTSRKFAAGLVSRSYGATTITNCQVSTLIHSSINGDGTHGGLVAMPDGQLTIKDCIYDGRLMTTNGTTRCGGFVGWHNGQNITVTSSLYAPNAVADGETPITDGATFVRGAGVGTYCYYTAPMGEAQGRQVFDTLPAGELCMQAKAADGKMYYLPCTVSGINPTYALEAGISITPTVTGLDKAALTFGTDYTTTLDGNAVATFPVTITSGGEHTLTLTGKSADYTGTKSITVAVIAALAGDGTAENPYLIRTANDWNLLATDVAESKNYNGKYVKLMADIDITLPVGVREDKPFSGTFLGNGHTLTADIRNNNADVQGTAPFRYIKDATIQNVTVAGTIASNSRHTAGLVGFADGTNLIENCTVSATLNLSSNYAGGIVGHGLTSNTTLRGCVFAGAINGISGDLTSIGGLWGWSDSGTPVLENCLEKGTYTAIFSMHPVGLQGDKGTITGCYYLGSVKGSPDHACTVNGAYQVAATDTGGEVYKPVTAVDGNTYYMPCIVSNMITLYHETGSDIKVEVPTVTAADGTVLTAGTDFTCSPETVREKGDYTLTISGRGTYSGTKTMTISVTESMYITPGSTTLSSGEYLVYQDVTVNDRITICGDVVLNLGKDAQLTVPKGIELSKGNTLTINGPGTLTIENVDEDNAGIGAVEVGTLVINGGTITVGGGKYGAGIGGSRNNVSGGSITINGGLLISYGGSLVNAAGIGGGYDDKPGQYGVCGDIVINGGRVTPVSLTCCNIGPGSQGYDDTRYNSGTLTLSWTNPDDDIYIGMLNSLQGTHLNSITFAEGRKFLLKDTKTIATPDNIQIQHLVPLLALTDTGDNSSLVDDCDGMKLPVVLQGRTLYKDGKWNTLCLPFDVTLSGSPLAGAVARPLAEAGIQDSKLNMTFGDAVTTLEAGTPYIIKWARADDYVDDDAHNILNPFFSVATIDKTDRSYDNGLSGDQRVRFTGTYKNIAFDSENKSILLMRGANTLYYPTTGASLGAQHAYIEIGDGASLAPRLTAFSIDFGDEEATGVITPLSTGRGAGGEAWYTLDGRKLQGKPSRAGVYINNGAKRVVR